MDKLIRQLGKSKLSKKEVEKYSEQIKKEVLKRYMKPSVLKAMREGYISERVSNHRQTKVLAALDRLRFRPGKKKIPSTLKMLREDRDA